MHRLFSLWISYLALAATALAQITLSPATKEVGAGRNDYTMLVDTGETWSAVSDSSWAYASPQSGRGQSIITITVLSNASSLPRSATITINGTAHIITQTAPVSSERKLMGVGYAYYGQLGIPLSPPHSRPASTIADVASVAAGKQHTLIVKTDGTLWAFGSSSFNQLGYGGVYDQHTPVQVASNVLSAAAGDNHSLFVKTDGTLWVMGDNSYGQSGNGTKNYLGSTPVQVASGVASVAAGGNHSLFVKTDGTLWGMGDNAQGQLGDGTFNTTRATPVQIASNVVSIAAGPAHSLFVKSDGTLWATGFNFYGQLGLGGSGVGSKSALPVQVATGVSSVATGFAHSLFVKTDGTLWAMGDNFSGQLGDGTNTQRPRPVQVASGVARAEGGASYSLFVKTDGTLWGMGGNLSGQLGDGTTLNRNSPIQISSDVTLAVAGSSHSIFLKSDGTLWGVGDDAQGQLGDGLVTQKIAPILLSSEIKDAVAGGSHSLFIDADENLWATGMNTQGQLGDGTTVSRMIPVQIATAVASVSAKYSHTLFVKTDGTLWGMGNNGNGQLGDGTSTQRNSPVPIMSGVKTAETGGFHSLILKTDGTLWAMGANLSGQLGDSTLSPVLIASEVAAISAGEDHSLFIKTNGTLWAMGRASDGRLGNGSFQGIAVTPVQISTDVVAASAGLNHSLYIKSDGTLWAMGLNLYGQLGDGTTSQRLTPVQVASQVAAALAGYEHSFFIKTDGTLWAMGKNNFGIFGNGQTTNFTVPTQVASGISSVASGYSHALFIAGSIGAFAAYPKADLGLFWPNPTTITYGTALSDQQLSATTDPSAAFISLPRKGTVEIAGPAIAFTPNGLFTYTPTIGTLLNAGTHALSATFTPEDSTNYNSVTIERTLTVNKALATVTLGNLTTTYNGAAQPVSVTTAPAGLNAVVTYDGSATPPTNAGSYAVVATVVEQNYYGSATGTLVIQKAVPQLTWADPAAITYGTLLSATQLNATADVPGTFTYDLAAGTLLNAGSHTLNVTFTPSDTANYVGVAAQRTLTVNKATQTISFTAPADRPFDATPIALSATATSSLTVSFTVVFGPASISGSTLTLTGAGTVTVRAAQAGDSNYSAAPDVDRSFLVTGNVNSWLRDKFTASELADLAITGLTADPDGDGLTNLLEYALGLEPKADDITGRPEMGATTTDWTYTYTRPADRPDLTYEVEASTDLATWSTSGVTLARTAAGPTETWQAAVPFGTGDQVFLRLKITQN